MTRVRPLGLALALGLCGCFTYYSDGPAFQTIPVAHVPATHGLVYFYRPPKAWGAANFLPIQSGARYVDLACNAYAVFAFPVGSQHLQKPALTVDVQHDKPVYVRLEFKSQDEQELATLVPEAEALVEIGALYLAPGGGARTTPESDRLLQPAPQQPPPSSAAPPAATPPAQP
jgi:hypothetical protein